MKKTFLLTGAIILSAFAASQAQNTGYKYGNDSLERNMSRYLMRTDKDFTSKLSSKVDMYVILFFKVNIRGEIENITFTSFTDTSLSKDLYAAIMRTSGDWINNTSADVFFELPCYFMHEGENGAIGKYPMIKTVHYENGKQVRIIELPVQLTTSFPEMH